MRLYASIGFSLLYLMHFPIASANAALSEDTPPQEICALCHSYDGISRMAKFPKLAAQRADYIESQVTAFMDGSRVNDGGQMSSIVTEIEPADIPAIAQWFASLPAPEPEVVDADIYKAGADIYQEHNCGQCHGETGTVNSADSAIRGVEVTDANLVTPHLSAQHGAYIKKQIADFISSERYHPNWFSSENDREVIMNQLSEDDVNLISVFLAGSER
ncbi:MAG: c-type cytochrome [Granulosicoccus sp.]|nr:c-type cytochrome [Granulosicoccus sp.]